MRKFIFVLLSVSMVISVNAWGDISTRTAKDAKPATAKKCLFPKSRKRAPDWVCKAHEESLTVAAVGSFHKSGAGAEFMEQMAAADARVHLARKLHESVQKKITESEDSATRNSADRDSTLINKITDEQLQGTKILKSAYGPKGRLYVLIGFDEAGAQKLYEAVAADYLAQKRK